VGGGEVGERKVRNLLQCGALVRLISRELTQSLSDLAEAGQVKFLDREYHKKYLEGIALAFVCTDDSELNTRVSLDAKERGIWINVADKPDLCSFILPATVSRGDLTISVSTSGGSPALAARIRARLEKEFGPEYEFFLDLMRLVRARFKAEDRPVEQNREIFMRLIESDLLETMSEFDLDRAEEILIEILGPGYTLSALGFKVEGREEA